MLREYVEGGGRVVLDAPGGWFDERGLVLDTAPGSAFETLFGTVITDYQYSSNLPRRLASDAGGADGLGAETNRGADGGPATGPADDRGRLLEGFIAALRPTAARPAAFYDTREIAVTRNTVGAGEAIVIGYEASHQAWKPGNRAAEGEMRRWTVGDAPLPYRCSDAVVYRLAAPAADHYFLINDGAAKSVVLETPAYEYDSAEDVIEERSLDIGGAIDLLSHSGAWIRMMKRRG
jgi:beta-galactosidase